VTQFATADELREHLGAESFTTAETTRANGLLIRASGLVQGAVRQTIELVEDDEIHLRGSRESTILLPQRPVLDVTSVVLDGEVIPSSDFYVEDDSIVRRCGWGHPRMLLVVTYSHGWDPIPDAIKAVVLGMVARVWPNPSGVMSERLGQAQVTYSQGPAPGVLLTADERRTVRQIVSTGARSQPIKGA
jgi:hypothetical protein